MHKRVMVTAIFAVFVLSNLVFFESINVGAQGNTVIKLSTHPDNIDTHDYFPEMAMDDAGNSYVVWRGGNWYGNYEIYWVKVDSTGTPGTIQMISTHPNNVGREDDYPQIDVDDAGNSYVVWQGWDNNARQIYWVKIDSTGTPGTIQIISTHPDNIDHHDSKPQIAVDDAGNSYVVWYGGSDRFCDDIYWTKVDSTSTPGTVKKVSDPNIPADCYKCRDPKIAIDSAGNSYVTWWSGEYNEYDIYWTKVDNTGTPGTPQKISNHPDNLLGSDVYPQIAVDDSGNSYVVWHSKHGYYDFDIYWTKVDSTGTPGTTLKVSTFPDTLYSRNYHPHIAVDRFGDSYVVWHAFGGDPDDENIYWAKIDSTGTLETVQMISNHPDNTSNEEYGAQVAVDDFGNSYVVWFGFDGNDKEIYWTYVNSAGIPGTAQKISTHPDNIDENDRFPHICLDSAGNSYVLWDGWHRTPDYYNNEEIYFTIIETPIQRDSDGDGVPDELDECPLENPHGLDADTNGCIDNLNDFPSVIQDINLEHGIENSLISKTENALKSFQKGNVQAAINQLEAFINQVEALKEKKISEEDADLLIQYALNIIQQLQQ